MEGTYKVMDFCDSLASSCTFENPIDPLYDKVKSVIWLWNIHKYCIHFVQTVIYYNMKQKSKEIKSNNDSFLILEICIAYCYRISL